MKNLFAIVLLVTAMVVTGCGDKKPPAKTTPAPSTTGTGTGTTTTPPADAPKKE